MGVLQTDQDVIIQTINLSSISAVLNSTKSTDIPNILNQLDSQEQVRVCSPERERYHETHACELSQVTLMKYLYKSMEHPDAQGGNSNVVLGWHEKVRPR